MKKKRIISIVAVVIVVLLVIWKSKVDKKDLIATPSTHENITFLKTEGDDFIDGHKVFFCLYDEDCDYIQFCIRTSRNNETLWHHPNDICFYVDDEKYPDYRYLSDTTWNKRYVTFLLENVTEFETIRCEYAGNICTASRG